MEGILVKRERGAVPPNPTGLVLSVDNGGRLHTVDVSNPGQSVRAGWLEGCAGRKPSPVS